MVEQLLEQANSELSRLIELTEEGIADIKIARKDRIDSHSREKTAVLNRFLQRKNDLDQALLQLANDCGGELENALSHHSCELLKKMRFNLNYLLAQNKKLANYTLSVKEFYDSLLENMLKDDIKMDGYKQVYSTSTTLNHRV